MSKNESQKTPANVQDTPNAESPLASNENPPRTKPRLIPMKRPKGYYKSESQDTVNKEPTLEHESAKPTPEHESAKPAKVTNLISAPAQRVAAHLDLEPPKVDFTPTSDLIVAARRILKGATADITPAPGQLPAGLQSLKPSKAEEVQRGLEQYQKEHRKTQQELAERSIEEQVSHALSGWLPLTVRYKTLMDDQHWRREHDENKRSIRQYENPEDFMKWVMESDITQMCQWTGPDRHSDAAEATSDEYLDVGSEAGSNGNFSYPRATGVFKWTDPEMQAQLDGREDRS